MKFDFFNNSKLPKYIRNILSPRREFSNLAKERFLATYDTRYGTAQAAVSSRFAFFGKAAVAFVAIVALTGGVSAYADTTNVPANNVLYPLKRLGENVQLLLASNDEKAQLQAIFAARRENEIAELQSASPSSPLVAKLEADMNGDLNASMSAEEKDDFSVNQSELQSFCNRVSAVIATPSLTVRTELLSHPDIFAQFKNNCGMVEGIDTTTARGSVNAAATSTGSTVNASGSLLLNLRSLFNIVQQSTSTSASTTLRLRIMRLHQLLQEQDGSSSVSSTIQGLLNANQVGHPLPSGVSSGGNLSSWEAGVIQKLNAENNFQENSANIANQLKAGVGY
jgi:hypothetical protein